MKEEEKLEEIRNTLMKISGQKKYVVKNILSDSIFIPKQLLDFKSGEGYYYLSTAEWENLKYKIDNALTKEEVQIKEMKSRVFASKDENLKALLLYIEKINISLNKILEEK